MFLTSTSYRFANLLASPSFINLTGTLLTSLVGDCPGLVGHAVVDTPTLCLHTARLLTAQTGVKRHHFLRVVLPLLVVYSFTVSHRHQLIRNQNHFNIYHTLHCIKFYRITRYFHDNLIFALFVRIL